MRFQGAIFDIDGVLVDSPHERAWREALQRLMTVAWTDLAGKTGYAPDPGRGRRSNTLGSPTRMVAGCKSIVR